MKKLITLLSTLLILSCFGESKTQTIDINSHTFSKENYEGEDGYHSDYFKYNLNGKEIYLKTNPANNFGIFPNKEYPNLDSLKIKKTKIEWEKSDVYSIEEIILNK